jgi:prephenate dehydrogenase
MTNVALLGYGRFGAALASLLRDADVDVRAFDARSPVPDEIRAASIPDLLSGRDFVVVAVPVPAMRGAFAAMRPLLSPSQIVVDVGSVKLGPAAAMAEVFGAEIPWVATHPMFGPISLSRGERPLVAVVCPSATHPRAVERVARLYERIGCKVVLEDEVTHDRGMAWTHALAFFVAKGMLDANVPLDIPYAPPSFQALARTVEAARSDAGHLYAALHRENPYAAEARRKLLDALLVADQNLSGASGGVPPPSSSLVLLPSQGGAQTLRETRELIDELDREMVELLERRAQLARRAAREKARLGRPVRDPEREAELLDARRRWADERGLDPASVHEIFESILTFSRRLQLEPSEEPGSPFFGPAEAAAASKKQGL